MIDTALIWSEIMACLPCISAVMWFCILLIARYDSFTMSERNIKDTLLWFYGLCAFAWFSFFFYNYQPAAFVYLNSFAYAAVLLMVVCCYRYVFQLTTADVRKDISVWHYIAASIVPGILFVYSLFVPFDVQEALVRGRGELYEGYMLYSVLFLSKPFLLFVYGAVYSVVCFRRLFAYYAMAWRKENEPIRLRLWVLILMGIMLTMLFFAAFMFFVPRSQLTSTGGFLTLIVLTCSQHVVLGYNAICRNFYLYIIMEEVEGYIEEVDEILTFIEEQIAVAEAKQRKYRRRAKLMRSPKGKLVAVPITKRTFESYMQHKKPYLKPQIKITDLVKPLNANRTALSSFVNETYGVNFNRYINRMRIEEMERLKGMPENAELKQAILAKMAGFSSGRHYLRAVEIEQEDLDEKQSEQSEQSE